MLNIAAIQGRLTADPELRHTQNDVAVTSFTVAVDRRKKDAGTDWVDVVAWRQTAEFVCKYFQKGQMIALTGVIQTRNYEDKQGNKRKAVEIVANDVSFCESRKREESKEPVKQPAPQPVEPVEEYEQAMLPPDDFLGDDDLPFD